MTDQRKGGIALICGALGTVGLMVLHPTGNDLFLLGQISNKAYLSAVVHSVAIATLPLLFMGAHAVSQKVPSRGRFSLGALVIFGLALAAAMVAIVVSGFVAGNIARRIINSAGTESDMWRILFNYNGALNQAFAGLFVVASSSAIILWSASILRTRALAVSIGVYGIIISGITIVALMFGYLRLDVHGFGLVAITQAIWYVTVGSILCRTAESADPKGI